MEGDVFGFGDAGPPRGVWVREMSWLVGFLSDTELGEGFQAFELF